MNFREFLKESKEDLTESSLSRIQRFTKKHDCATISAFRFAEDCGAGRQFTYNENQARNKKMKSFLLNKGYGVTHVDGSYIENKGKPTQKEVKENSFFVVNLENSLNFRKDLEYIANKFEQDSIAYMDSQSGEWILIGTSNCPGTEPKKGASFKLGTAKFGADAEIFTRVKNRPFVFESSDYTCELKSLKCVQDVHTLGDLSISEIRTMKNLYKEFEDSE